MAKTPQAKTGNQFIEQARKAGAHVEPAQVKKGVPFTKISTPKGSVYVTPGNTTLDPRTRKNYRHWFRLLGLLGVGLWLVDFLWGVFQLPPIF